MLKYLIIDDNKEDNNANEVENTDKEENTNNNNNTQQQQRFRFWIPSETVPSPHKYISLFKSHSHKTLTTNELLVPNETFNIVDIKYSSLGKNNSSSGEISLAYTIIIEQAPFIFSQHDIEFGNCSYCNRPTYLKYSCKCNEVHYCRKDCYDRDRMHKEQCVIMLTAEI